VGPARLGRQMLERVLVGAGAGVKVGPARLGRLLLERVLVLVGAGAGNEVGPVSHVDLLLLPGRGYAVHRVVPPVLLGGHGVAPMAHPDVLPRVRDVGPRAPLVRRWGFSIPRAPLVGRWRFHMPRAPLI